MRTALLLALLAETALAAPRVYDRNCEVKSRRSDRGGVACASYVPASDFEFAPSGSQGMGSSCSCSTSITASTGEALVFTRASVGTCDKSNGVSGILPGDLVSCAVNQPRISTVGTTGLKLGIFDTRTNVALYSEQLDHASWVKGTDVTVSADDVACPLAPDGTQTMDLVTFGGASGTGIHQDTSPGSVTVADSFYVTRKTGGATCVLNVTDFAAAPAGTNVTVGTTISRVVLSLAVTGTSGPMLREATAGDCVDACVWGGSSETGVSVSPYIKTEGTATARAEETARFAATIANDATGCIGVSYISTVVGALDIAILQTSNADPTVTAAVKREFEFRTTSNFRVFGNGFGAGLNVLPGLVSGTHRAVAYWTGSGSTLNGLFDGVLQTPGSFTAGTGATFVHLSYPANNINGWLYNVAIDTDESKCR